MGGAESGWSASERVADARTDPAMVDETLIPRSS